MVTSGIAGIDQNGPWRPNVLLELWGVTEDAKGIDRTDDAVQPNGIEFDAA